MPDRLRTLAVMYLGTITAVSGSSVNNRSQTSGKFAIDGIWPRLLFVTPTASGVTFRVRMGGYDSATVSTPTLDATTDDFGVAEQTSQQFETPRPYGKNTVVAIYGDGGAGAVKVYGLLGDARS